MRGRPPLSVKVEWDEGPLADFSTATLLETHRKLAREGGGERVLSTGDVKAAFSKASRVLEAEYTAPFLAHATMEPQNATAHVTASKCEVWAPTQSPALTLEQVKRLTGLSNKDITVHQTWAGGGFGRRFTRTTPSRRSRCRRPWASRSRWCGAARTTRGTRRTGPRRRTGSRERWTARAAGGVEARGGDAVHSRPIGDEMVRATLAGAPGFVKCLASSSRWDAVHEGLDGLRGCGPHGLPRAEPGGGLHPPRARECR